MKHKHMILIYILLMIVPIFSACSNKEGEAPIIIDQNESNSEAVNSSTTTGASPTEALPDEVTALEDSNPVDSGSLPADSNSIQNSSENGNSTVGDSQSSNIDDSESNSDSNATDNSNNNSNNDSNNNSNNNSVNNSDNDSGDNNDGKETETENSDQTNQNSTAKKIIAIDAGHQSKGNYELEPIGPGATTTKAKVSSGTQGVYTGVPEYKLNLVIAKKVEEELIKRGYEVFMIRDTHDVNLSNRERAEMANDSGADLFIRIHADGSDNPEVNGASTLYPSKDNPYVSDLSKASHTLSDLIIDSICENTGAKNRGAIARDDMSGINWCTLPVTIIEMGYMSNKKEDKLMQTEEYQNKIVKGICDGIDQYYE